MAEASLLSQKASMLEQDNFKVMLDLQWEEAGGARAHFTAHMLQNMVERLCPEEDPAD